MSKFLKVSRILSLIGGIIATIVSFSYYIMLVTTYSNGSTSIFALVITLMAIIASLISVIAAAILGLTRRFGTISFFTTSGILLVTLITCLIELRGATMALTTLPFYAIPFTLILIGGVFSVIKGEAKAEPIAEKVEEKVEEKKE